MKRSKKIEEDKTKFQDELSALINRHSIENGSNTPDFILAEYLRQCLDIFDTITKRRDSWWGWIIKLTIEEFNIKIT
jgi:hypothetical protein